MAKIIRYIGGGQCHPVDEQANILQAWLGDEFRIENKNGREAFEGLDSVDLFIASGLHYTGMGDALWPNRLEYVPMTDADMEAFRGYVASGRPVMGFHGGVASFNNRPEFGQLMGIYWNWVTTTHTPFGDWTMRPIAATPPLSAGVEEFVSPDEIYYNLQLVQGLKNTTKHLLGVYHKMTTSLMMTAEGGRIEGAGKVGYFGLGHAVESLHRPEVKQLFLNMIRWLLPNEA